MLSGDDAATVGGRPQRVTSSIVTRSRPIRTSAAARSSARDDGRIIVERCRCRTPPKKVRAAASWCAPPTIARRNAHATAVGLALVGFYHSHPDHPARPSQHDLDHAWPNFHYVIASVLEGRVDVTRAWRLRDDRSQFDETAIVCRRPVAARLKAAPTRRLHSVNRAELRVERRRRARTSLAASASSSARSMVRVEIASPPRSSA